MAQQAEVGQAEVEQGAVEPGVAEPGVAEADTASALPARPRRSRTDLVEETRLLDRARVSLQTDPHAALAITNEHRRTYPRGALRQEREVLAIDALVRAGRRTSAEARARRFLGRHPRSAHSQQVRAILAR